MTPEQQKALALARARRRRSEAEGKAQSPATSTPEGTTAADRIAAAKAGTLTVSPERAAQQAEIDAMAEGMMGQAPTQQTIGQRLYDNIIGDPNNGVTSTGERIAAGVDDASKAILAGAARGAAGLVGLPGTIGDLIDAGVVRGGQALGAFPEDMIAPKSSFSSGALIEGMGELTGGATDYKGQNMLSRFAGTVAEFLPGAAAFGGGSASNLLRFGVAPGVASEAAGVATEGTAAEPYARIGAAIAAPALVSGVANAARRIVSPYGGADPERLRLAKVLDEAGVPMTAGQRVGNEGLRRREGTTSAGQDLMEAQGEAFTRAALKTIGVDAARATEDVLRSAAERIGRVFDDVTDGVDLMPSPATVAAARAADDTYKALAPTAGQSPMVGQVADAIADAAAKGGSIPAATARVWRSRLSKLTTSADEATREAARAAMGALDEAFLSLIHI